MTMNSVVAGMAWRRRRRREVQFGASYLQDDLLVASCVVQICQEEEEKPRWGGGGSVPGRQIVPHDRFTGHHRLYADYFCDDPVYRDDVFRGRLFFNFHSSIVL
jgi:hypothetical protein